MSDTEEWTVVCSKSQQRKVGTGGEKVEKNNQGRGNQRKNGQLSAGAGGGKVKNVLSSSKLVKEENDRTTGFHQPGNSGTIPCTSKQQPYQYSLDVKNRRGACLEGRKATFPVSTSRTANAQSSRILKSDPEDKRQNKAQATCSQKPIKTECTRQTVKVEILTQGPSSNDPSVKNENQASASRSVLATVDSPSKKKKKKPPSKTERRKKREEKFYQALYQNKDSHIQFVSADVIRKLQNESQKPSTSKPGPTERFVSSTVMHDFPTLSVDISSDKKPAKKVTYATCMNQLQASSSSTNQNIPAVHSLDVTQTQILASKIVKEFPSMATIVKEKCSTDTCSTSTTVPANTSKGKKSKQPMIIDVSTLIITKKKEKDMQKKFASPNTLLGKSGVYKKENFKVTAGNPLDSSGPGVINRGKIRQKKKKPTKLKLTIMKSRALKKMLLEEKSKQDEETLQRANNLNNVPSVDAEATLTENTLPVDNVEPSTDIKLESTADADPVLSNNDDNAIANTQLVEIKSDEVFSNDNCIDNDITLKFVKLLDEISVLKIADETSPEIELAVKHLMHNRKFRDYCDMYTSKELHRHVMSLLSELYRFQDRLYHTDPIKFKTKRRFVSGLKEAFSYLNLNKVQLLIIAPDIEKNPEPGGLDERITQILILARAKGIPYIFSGTKYNLGKPMKIKTPISIISILDKQNCEETFRALMDEASQLRERYHMDFAIKAKELKAQQEK